MNVSSPELCLLFDNGTKIENLTLGQELLHGNRTSCLEHAPWLTPSAFLKSLILLVMTLLSFLANLATIWSIARSKKKKHNCSAVYTLILHLSVADVLVTVFCMGGEALWSYSVAWLWGNIACKIFKFLQMFSLYLSTFVLVLIGVDRFIAVKYPMKSLNTAQRCNRLVLLMWIISFVLSIPQVIIFHVAQGPFIEEFSQCVTHGFYTEAWQEQLYATMSLIFMFILPLTVLVITYVNTVITIARGERVFKLELASSNSAHITGDVNRRRLMHRAKTKSLRISVVIVAAFVIWWTPYYIMMIIFMFLNPDKYLSADLQKGIFFFGMSNSLVNPLIYGAFHLWPQKRRFGKHWREGSTLHLRNTTTNASFTTNPRVRSSSCSRQLHTNSSNVHLHINQRENNETVFIHPTNERKNNCKEFNERSDKLILHYGCFSNSDVKTQLLQR